MTSTAINSFPKFLRSGAKALLAVLSLSFCSHEAALAARLSEYTGTVGSAKVRFTVVSQATSLSGPLPAGPLTGNYFYTRYLKDIPIEGEIGTDRDITIYELDEQNKKSAVIKGKFPEKDPQHHFGGSAKLGTEVIVGTWSRLDGTGSLPVYLNSVSDTFADLQHRYLAAGIQDDQSLEAKVRSFRDAVLEGNKDAVASMVVFPITTEVSGKRRELGSKAELLKHYDHVFTRKYINAIKEAAPHNMFVRYDGVMLGDSGEVWFDADGKVKSLNN